MNPIQMNSCSQETIYNRTFTAEAVQVDCKRFIDCSFHQCTLEYSGLPFTLERTRLAGCRYVFFGAARATIHFLQLTDLLKSADEAWS